MEDKKAMDELKSVISEVTRYVELVEKIKILAKETPNDFSLGSKIRKLLNCLDSGQTYVDEEVRL
jgi:hypothetical protein